MRNSAVLYFLLLFFIVFILVSFCACSSSKRSDSKLDAGDSGSDFDGGGTDLPWDTDTDTELIVHKPQLIFADPPNEQLIHFIAAGFDGDYVAVSRVEVDDSYPYTDDTNHTLFLSFPWDSPDDVMINSFLQAPPACPNYYTTLAKTSIPHAHPDGFLLLTTTRGDEDCELVQSLWDVNANLLEGPTAFEGLFVDGIPAMDPNGCVDSNGSIVTGTIKGEGFDGTDTEGLIYLDIDRWNSPDDHNRLLHFVLPWNYAPSEGSGYGFGASLVDQNIYLDNGVYTVFAEQVEYDPTNRVSKTVFARADTGGNIITAPQFLENDIPPVSEELENTTYGYANRSFTANENLILEFANVLYMDLDGFFEYEPSISDPFLSGFWSRTLDFDGTPNSSWNLISEQLGHTRAIRVQLAWSGRYFGACYSDQFDTLKMIPMDQNGIPVSEPIDLFWEIPPVENKNLACDIVAIDEETFVVVLGVYAYPPEAYENGIWATQVEVSVPIE